MNQFDDKAFEFCGRIANTAEFVSRMERSFLPAQDAGEIGWNYFSSMVRCLERLENCTTDEQRLTYITENWLLRKWFAVMLCIMAYGNSDGYRLESRQYAAQQHPFLRGWMAAIGQTEELGVYSLENGEDRTLIGCCSEVYYILPAMEIQRTGAEWEKLYDKLLTAPQIRIALSTGIPKAIAVRLLYSANRLEGSAVFRFLRNLITECIAPDIAATYRENMPCRRVGNMDLFCTTGSVMPEAALADDIYLTLTHGKYRAFYPFSPEFADAVDMGSASVDRISLRVLLSDAKKPAHGAVVRGTFRGQVRFVDPNTGDCSVVPYLFHENKCYDVTHLHFADMAGTFCMYPDLPVEYEDRCSKYVFFSNLNSTVTGRNEEAVPAFSDHAFISSSTGDKLCVFASNRQLHVIPVKSSISDAHAGYVLNLRRCNKTPLPPLLPDFEAVQQIDVSHEPANPGGRMYVYIDFGSSSSVIGYKCGDAGAFQTKSIMGNTSPVREILGQFDRRSYYGYLNFPSFYDHVDVVSSTILKFSDDDEKGMPFPYQYGIVPFVQHLSYFESIGMEVHTSHKESLTRSDIRPQTKAILMNLCFAALCRAVDENCREAVLLPSIPNVSYEENYKNLLDKILEEIRRTIFPDLKTIHLLGCRDSYLLYESIAVSNSSNCLGDRTLTVNVDIGDLTMDLSAVYNDFRNGVQTKTVCGYSSLKYAGKQLLKRSVRDMLLQIGAKAGEKNSVAEMRAFLTGENGRKAVLVPKHGEDLEDYRVLVELLCRKFKPSRLCGGLPADHSWESIFTEMLGKCEVAPDDCDEQLKADLLLRYAVILPVIRHFIETSVKNCELEQIPAITICFYGGGSKGVQLLDRLTGDFLLKMSAYFREFFSTCSISIPEDAAKTQLLSGLEKPEVFEENDGRINVKLASFKSNSDWSRINPKEINYIRSRMRAQALPFSGEDPPEENLRKRHDPKFFLSAEDGFTGWKQYVQEAISAFTDGEIAELLKHTIDLVENDPKIVSAINASLDSGGSDSAFIMAADSDIYPEMIESVAYLMETGRVMLAITKSNRS